MTGSSIRVVDDRTVEGTVESQAFCGGKSYTTYFTTKFDKPFKSSGTWSPTGGTPGSRESSGGAGLRGAWLTFGGGGQVTATTAISQVDAQGARVNLAAEHIRSFDAAKADAQRTWRRELSSVDIKGGTPDDRTVFYTSLYHTLLQPLTANDADGRYYGFDKKVHRAIGWTYYDFFSLWDTYRTQNQLLALLRPDRAKDIAKSILAIHDQGGWLPRWAYASQETNTMTGDPVTPFLVDLWRFGALSGNEMRAYQALLQNSTQIPPASSPFQGRSGNASYQQDGFVQYDPNFPKKGQDTDPNHGASATLEYALGDCSLSVMAAALGKKSDAAALSEQARTYRTLWDASQTDRGFTGFFRPKVAGGDWFTPATGPYSPQSQDGFHEGTAWQYQWLVQQDVPGLVQRMGGPAATGKRLDDFFAYDELVKDPAAAVRENWVVGPYDYYDQFRYNPNNEPDLHSPWMYALTGQPHEDVRGRAGRAHAVHERAQRRHRQRRPRHHVGLVRLQRARALPRRPRDWELRAQRAAVRAVRAAPAERPRRHDQGARRGRLEAAVRLGPRGRLEAVRQGVRRSRAAEERHDAGLRPDHRRREGDVGDFAVLSTDFPVF